MAAAVEIDINPSTTTVDIVVPPTINTDLKLEGGQPIDLKLEGGQAIQTASEIKLEGGQPIQTSSALSLHVDKLELQLDPLKAELQIDPLKTLSVVDLKPVVLDLCLTANIGKVPSLCIRQPYHHHVGFTLYGTEVWGLTFSGHQETVVEELNRQPQVAWGSAAAWPPRSAPRSAAPAEPPSRHRGGLRIRLGP